MWKLIVVLQTPGRDQNSNYLATKPHGSLPCGTLYILLHLGHKIFRGVFILHKGIFPCLLFNSFIPSSVGNLVHYTTFIFGHQIPLLTCIDIHVNDDVFCHPDFWQVSFLLIETLHSNELTINNDLLFYNLVEYSKLQTVMAFCLQWVTGNYIAFLNWAFAHSETYLCKFWKVKCRVGAELTVLKIYQQKWNDMIVTIISILFFFVWI